MESPEERARIVAEMFRQGKTLQEIAKLYNVTRERVRQLVRKGLYYELLAIVPKPDESQINILISIIKKDNAIRKSERKAKALKSRKNEFIKSAPSYTSVVRFAQDHGIIDSDLREFLPEVVSIIEDLKMQKKARWSRSYLRCRNCGTTRVKHVSYGLCENCYFKSPIFKEMVKASRLRNIDKWRAREKKYYAEYRKRPEVIEKEKRILDMKFFDGNRSKAMKRDQFRCKECGISQDESIKRYGRDLYVSHIDRNKDNNDLANLVTLCRRCFNRKKIVYLAKGAKTRSRMG